MNYYRSRFTSFEEFQREVALPTEDLGKDELELLEEIDCLDRFDEAERRRRNWWD